MAERVRSVSAHEIAERPPMQVEVGEQVTAGRRDTTWPAFVFVTADSGEGWVPGRYLSADSGPAVVTHAYDTTELPTSAGEVLDVLVRDDESGWLWCRAAAGAEGWVPVSTVTSLLG